MKKEVQLRAAMSKLISPSDQLATKSTNVDARDQPGALKSKETSRE